MEVWTITMAIVLEVNVNVNLTSLANHVPVSFGESISYNTTFSGFSIPDTKKSPEVILLGAELRDKDLC